MLSAIEPLRSRLRLAQLRRGKLVEAPMRPPRKGLRTVYRKGLGKLVEAPVRPPGRKDKPGRHWLVGLRGESGAHGSRLVR